MKSIQWWKLLIVFLSAILLQANSIVAFRFLMDKNWFGMAVVVGLGPFLSLPMNHFSIEVKTLKERALIAFAFCLGFMVGVIIIRPFFI